MHYIAMELLEGEDLRSYITRCGALSIVDAVMITIVMAEADRLRK